MTVVNLLFTILPNGLIISEELKFFMHKHLGTKLSIYDITTVKWLLASLKWNNIKLYSL